MSVYAKDASVNNNHLTQNEVHLYGSSRLGILNVNEDLEVAPQPPFLVRGNKFFELSNHLGNVLVTICDKKLQIDDGNGNVAYYTADVISANDYYPFGMMMPERKFASDKAVYGFNGMRKENEIYGEGNAYDFGARIYDNRLGRWLSIDPLQMKYPEDAPYIFAGNSPNVLIDIEGLYKYIIHLQYNAKTGKYQILKVVQEEGLKSRERRVANKAAFKNSGSFMVSVNDWYDYATFKVTVINGKPNEKIDERITNIDDIIIGDVKTTTDFDWEWYANTKVSDGKGGIVFSSKYGLNGAPPADFPDGAIENIDLLMDVIDAVGLVNNIEVFGRSVQKAFKNKNGFDHAELVLKLAKDYIQNEINEVKEKHGEIKYCRFCEQNYDPETRQRVDGEATDTTDIH